MTSGNRFITDVAANYPDYLRDESRRTGRAESISFPTTEHELRSEMADLYSRRIPITLQGARTGITGGAVPDGGHILNLSRMNRVTGMYSHHSEDAYVLTVQPGVLLSELSIGGMVSCNASGARSFLFGPTRKYIETLRIVLPDGSLLDIKRGEHKSSGRKFRLITHDGREIAGGLPDYIMRDVKNASGYFAADNMDLIDLFIGSEGTLGVFSEIGIKTIPAPPVTWGVMAFLPSEETALSFVHVIRSTGQKPAAIEFFNSNSLNLLRKQKETNPAFSEIPPMPPALHTAVYVEYDGKDQESVENAVVNMSEVLTTVGGDSDLTWMASDSHCLLQLKDFRHALPEAVNLQIDERRKKEPELTKLGTDLAVPDNRLNEIMEMYRRDLSDAHLESVIFGHIGNNHLHVNIIPNTLEEYRNGKDLYLKWAARVVEIGGSVSAEHGIGKLKTDMRVGTGKIPVRGN